MKKITVTRSWIMLASVLLIAIGIGYINRDVFELTIENTEYYIASPSVALCVAIVAACMAGILAHFFETVPHNKYNKAISIISSIILFLCINALVFFDPLTFTPDNRTSVGSVTKGHNHTYELESYVFWNNGHNMAIAGKNLAKIFRERASNTGTASEFKDITFTRKHNDSQDSLVEKRIFRCETANITWKIPLVWYRYLEISGNDGMTLQDIQGICNEVKETEEKYNSDISFSYRESRNMYIRNYSTESLLPGYVLN